MGDRVFLAIAHNNPFKDIQMMSSLLWFCLILILVVVMCLLRLTFFGFFYRNLKKSNEDKGYALTYIVMSANGIAMVNVRHARG